MTNYEVVKSFTNLKGFNWHARFDGDNETGDKVVSPTLNEFQRMEIFCRMAVAFFIGLDEGNSIDAQKRMLHDMCDLMGVKPTRRDMLMLVSGFFIARNLQVDASHLSDTGLKMIELIQTLSKKHDEDEKDR